MVKEFGHNQWALIIGGSSGLGLATARKLAKEGLNICIVHRNARSQMKEIEKSFDAISATGVRLLTFNKDALKPENREAVIASLREKGTVKVLVHSIAKGNLKPMLSASEPTLENQDFLITLNAMALSLYDWTKALIAANALAPNSRVVAFTSEGSTRAWKYYAAVSAAKAALEAIVRSMALEFAAVGITANCIQAGVTDTDSLRRIPGSDDLKKHTLTRNPHQRLTRPEDIANAVYLLCKAEANWINGCVIPVDGGEHLR